MIDVLTARVRLWGRGQGRRRGAGGAYRRPCPVLPSAHCGGKKRELERSRQCESGQAPAASLISVFAEVNLSVKTRPGQPLHPEASCSLLGTDDGARRGTLDAMSRRKLGSRPQHLSAIQGKPSGAAMWGYFFSLSWSAVIVYPSGTHSLVSPVESSHGSDAHRR